MKNLLTQWEIKEENHKYKTWNDKSPNLGKETRKENQEFRQDN